MSLYGTAIERLALVLGDRALRTEYVATLRRWRRIQHLPAEELRRLQHDGLRELLEYATTTVPYHRAGAAARHDDPYEWLRRLPVMTKHDLRDSVDELVVGDRSRLVASPSSGSSGIQSTVYMTPREVSRTQAYQTLLWEWAGYRLGTPLLQTGMTPDRGAVKAVKDRLLRTTYVPAFGLDDEDALEVITGRGARRSRHFGGYASSLYVVARAASSAGIDQHFDSVISWGDKMFPEYRSLIERTFRTKVYDTYGTTEGLVIAGQRDVEQYYVLSPHVVVELLDDEDRPVPDGELGRVVVTRLDSRAMPLIRYSLGDLAIAAEASAQAELGFPVLERIVGRDTDIVETPSGRHLIVHTFTGIFEFFTQIQQFRVVQEHRDGITVEYIPGDGFQPGVLTALEQRLREIVREPFAIDWTEVDHIPSTPSGKPQIVASTLARRSRR